MITSPVKTQFSKTEIERVFKLQQQAQLDPDYAGFKNRMNRLKRLYEGIVSYRKEIQEALNKDLGKPVEEADLSEVLPAISELKYVRKNLYRWTRDKRVPKPLPTLLGSSSWITYQPKGVVLIIAPWNYPIMLSLSPLITALAAGNCAIIKPSEHTPHSSAVIKKLVAEKFDEKEVMVFEGAVETAQALLDKPFNHIFFTGSPMVGKIVMAAASKHLSSITLELGGKSPVIVDETANVNLAAKRIMWGKLLNSGQVCLAPDYIYVHEAIKDRFIEACIDHIQQFLGENPMESPDYARIVNTKNFNRVKSYLDDAVARGAKIEVGGQTSSEQRFISPTLLSNVSPDSTIMKEEIFGPLLPIMTFKDFSEPIAHINAGERPLGMYIFSRNRRNIRRAINETRAGGSTINHVVLHYVNHFLPFGGVNNSGIGKAHGYYGFLAFSNARAVYKQRITGTIDRIMPPFTAFKRWMIDLNIKYF